ncbi:MAG: hypothetical protein CL566_09680 [Alphaproteobacteria bacterium]|nr:hypothetical protein [Alphaproteobacteria bacterium]
MTKSTAWCFPGNWRNGKTIFDNANFTKGNFFDGGAGANHRVEGSEGTDFIFDGNGEDGSGYSNGLVIFEGFDSNGDQRTEGVEADDVKFTNKGDGTWRIDFVNPATQNPNGDGSITFAAGETSDINLRDGSNTVQYTYNDATDSYGIV